MSRNLRTLLAAALTLTALGITASAHAADEFHCSTFPCRGKLSTDGTGAAAHHVLIFENETKTESVSFTCGSLRGTAEFVSGTDLSLGWVKGSTDREAYVECKINGTPGVVIHMNGCKYTFTGGALGRTDRAELHLLCGVEEEMEITIPESTCVFGIPPQTMGGGTGNSGGVGYTTSGTPPNRELTFTINAHQIVVKKKGNCEAIIKAAVIEGTYTTGNTLVTGQTSAGVMAEAWFE